MKIENKIKIIEQCYNDFFQECFRCNRCKQKSGDKMIEKCINDGEINLYNHTLELTPNYFDNKDKLLIIGQERAGGSQYNIKVKSENDVNKLKFQSHWFRTILTIIKFHYSFNNEKMFELEKTENRQELSMLYDGRHDYAFTDYFKCGFTLVKGDWSGKEVVHTNLMSENCIKILQREIQILNPNIIIKQGQFGDLSYFDDFFGNKELIAEGEKNKKMKLYRYINNNMFFIDSYHPNSFSPTWYDIRDDLYDLIDKYKVNK